MESFSKPISLVDIKPVEKPTGIFRRTLSYNKETMLCHFEMKKGAQIPLHNHFHVQNGFCIAGKIRFITQKGDFIVKAGDSYIFNSNETHGADILEDSVAIEVFSPCREEYKP